MNDIEDLKRTIRRNKLLGMWAAEQMGLAGADAQAYSDGLAQDALDPETSDVLTKIRKDFDSAGIAQSDEQILVVMNEFTLQAGGQTQGKGNISDAAAVALKRKLKS